MQDKKCCDVIFPSLMKWVLSENFNQAPNYQIVVKIVIEFIRHGYKIPLRFQTSRLLSSRPH